MPDDQIQQGDTTGATPGADDQGKPDQSATDGLADAGKKALEEERRSRRAADRKAAELEARLREFEDRDKSEAQKVSERAAQAEARAVELESRALRLEVAFEKGLTKAQAKRLVGSTREELEADADEVLRDFPVQPAGPVKPAGDVGQGPRKPAAPSNPNDKISAGLAAYMQ